jgi:hypothetical protein
MAPVPVGFPYRLDDAKLDSAINGMLERGNWDGFDNFGGLQPELKIALVAAGLRERERREDVASNAKALRLTYATLVVSVIALVVAVISTLRL